ncbi:hypothetical protein RRG08_060233 [Elysia crispata]|uniref:Uncharacterized protein n=1 Tax=Elysia crispata TaxID=231223 RepID=A0AAE1DP28_9GAST|nr:hypothetical protein RRG08_060233 [Elysia crispata]
MLVLRKKTFPVPPCRSQQESPRLSTLFASGLVTPVTIDRPNGRSSTVSYDQVTRCQTPGLTSDLFSCSLIPITSDTVQETKSK